MQEVDGAFYPDTEYVRDVGRWNNLRAFLPRAYPYVKMWGSCIDGGAFAGMWSQAYLKRFNRVYAFEPIPENVACIAKNAPAATIIPCALTDTQGIRTFRVKGGNFAHLGEGDLAVWGTTIDSFVYRDLGLIKLDVEGQEIQALNGAVKTIKYHQPVICIEVKYEGEEIRSWLRAHGYGQKEGNGLDEIWAPE